MTKRSFLAGVLVGVLLGVGVTWLAQSVRSVPTPITQVPPVQYTVPEGALGLQLHPRGPIDSLPYATPAPGTVPPGWQRHEFNGGHYYIRPLGPTG